jgi:hypothetical protein
MSRLKSEDPAAAEDLTPQQEGLVEGTGLRPFYPPPEGLEDRQFLDADFGDEFLALLLPTAGGGDPRDGPVRVLGGQQQSVGARIAGQAAAQQRQALIGEERIGAIRCNDCIAQQDGSLLLSLDATVGADQHRLQLVLTARQDGGGTYYECTGVFQDRGPNVRLSDDPQSRMPQQLAHVTGPQTPSAIDAVFAVLGQHGAR